MKLRRLVGLGSHKGSGYVPALMLGAAVLLIPLIAVQGRRGAIGRAAPAHPQPDDQADPHQQAYYVATSGNDGNPGTRNAPWRTIQHAASTIPAGSTVYVHGGVYHETVMVGVSGSAATGYTSFRNYPGERPIIDGSGLTVPAEMAGLFVIVDQSYVAIEGFELQNYRTATRYRVPIGISILGTAHHIRIRANRIHAIETNYAGMEGGDAHGIAVYGTAAPESIHDITIESNELYDLKLGSSEALVLNGNVERFVVRDNLVHDINNIAIDLIGFEETAPDPAFDQARDGLVQNNLVFNVDSYGNPAYGPERSAGGIYVDGGRDIVVERNTVHNANIGIELASEHAGRATSGITVRSNFIYHNDIAGIAIGGYDPERGRTERCRIVNNTLFENDLEGQGNGELMIQFDTRDNIVKNNIFYSTDQNLLIANAYTENTGNVVDSNLYFAPGGVDESTWQWRGVSYTSLAAYQAATGNDARALFADPVFVDRHRPDLHLNASSPAIGRGENLSISGDSDIDGDPRVIERIDIGADERLMRTFLPGVQTSE